MNNNENVVEHVNIINHHGKLENWLDIVVTMMNQIIMVYQHFMMILVKNTKRNR